MCPYYQEKGCLCLSGQLIEGSIQVICEGEIFRCEMPEPPEATG